ncbi:MAG: hypothetical protein IPJ40_03030 [Saprospirales bacterium]|nr:hypothetical protein [Saprospirales bacterium]
MLALTEKTPGQIIRDLRMRKAKDLLLNTDLTVAEIAFSADFQILPILPAFSERRRNSPFTMERRPKFSLKVHFVMRHLSSYYFFCPRIVDSVLAHLCGALQCPSTIMR